MNTILNQKKILELLKDFYEFAHVRVGLFAPDGKELIAYPQELSEYCTNIRKTEAGYRACMKSDESAYKHATSNDSFYIYTCHAGLTEMVVPIRGQGILLGYLMIGQFRMKKRKDFHSQDSLPVLDLTQIKAALHILQACAAYVWMDEYIRIQDYSLGMKVKEYIDSHLDQKIQISDLMREFGVGKTTLCNTVKEEFHMTITQLCQSLRIKEACSLLHHSDLSVSEIARRVGFDDYNYFTRVFRKCTGTPPSAYRKGQP